MASKFFDQDAPDPTRSPFFEGELAQSKEHFSIGDAIVFVGALGILFAPFTIALAYWLVTR